MASMMDRRRLVAEGRTQSAVQALGDLGVPPVRGDGGAWQGTTNRAKAFADFAANPHAFAARFLPMMGVAPRPNPAPAPPRIATAPHPAVAPAPVAQPASLPPLDDDEQWDQPASSDTDWLR